MSWFGLTNIKGCVWSLSFPSTLLKGLLWPQKSKQFKVELLLEPFQKCLTSLNKKWSCISYFRIDFYKFSLPLDKYSRLLQSFQILISESFQMFNKKNIVKKLLQVSQLTKNMLRVSNRNNATTIGRTCSRLTKVVI